MLKAEPPVNGRDDITVPGLAGGSGEGTGYNAAAIKAAMSGITKIRAFNRCPA